MLGKESERINPLTSLDASSATRDEKMTEVAILASARPKTIFLGDIELPLIGRQAEEVDAVYGETLDSFFGIDSDTLTRKPRAA